MLKCIQDDLIAFTKPSSNSCANRRVSVYFFLQHHHTVAESPINGYYTVKGPDHGNVQLKIGGVG